MRVTDNARLFAVLRNSTTSTVRLTEASRRASAGARVNRASDDPVAYATSVRRGSAAANLGSRSRIARASADELSIAERTLDAASELLSEARALAVQGSNETLSTSDRAALAQRISGIREQVLEIANKRGADGYLFGGSKTNAPPFDSSGAFLGNDDALFLPVTEGVSPRKNASGAKAFTAAGGVDVFAELASLQTALSTNDVTGIRNGIDKMQKSYEQVVSVQVDAGLGIERFHNAADTLDDAALFINQSRARDVGAEDLAELATELSAASNAYSQSLEVTRRLLALPSLADR
ncbi:MAG: hypothetical protein JST00_05280 [Deltaproteobacteria bacterium]|nr:hypothetical protein [Deltaproteobacteria bacterium]